VEVPPEQAAAERVADYLGTQRRGVVEGFERPAVPGQRVLEDGERLVEVEQAGSELRWKLRRPVEVHHDPAERLRLWIGDDPRAVEGPLDAHGRGSHELAFRD
jgi:hypothetical protein